jgi:hypothetical protein
MAQVGWVYLDDLGKQHRIGLYHGDQSGHLVIYCNMRVIQIDFLVKETRTYSFFVEDELCEIQLYRENVGFSYGFKVNKQVDTPRNRLRRADERRNRKLIIAFITGLVVLIAGLVIGLQYWDKHLRRGYLVQHGMATRLTPETERLLNTQGRTAVARLVIVSESTQRKVFYSFRTHDSTQVTGRFTVPSSGDVLLPNGFPLTDNDEFVTTYQPSDPQVHRLNFYQPTGATIGSYVRRAIEAESRANPLHSTERSLCFASAAVKVKGWQSLGDIIYQTATEKENPRHNRDSYRRLLRDSRVEQAVKQECWDK